MNNSRYVKRVEEDLLKQGMNAETTYGITNSPHRQLISSSVHQLSSQHFLRIHDPGEFLIGEQSEFQRCFPQGFVFLMCFLGDLC